MSYKENNESRSYIDTYVSYAEATDRSKVFEIEQEWKPTFLTNDEFSHLMLESLDAFMVVFNSVGSVFYASESVASQLGYMPVGGASLTRLKH